VKHVYVASHGNFATGVVESLALLIGEEHGVKPVCAYQGEIATTEQLERVFEELVIQAAGEEVVIFTDLLGGSVNNSAARTVLRHDNVYVVAGVNLTLLLEFLLCEAQSVKEAINYATATARESIVFINAVLQSPTEIAGDHP